MRNKKLLALGIFLIKFNLLAIPMYLVIFLNLEFPFLQNFIAFSSHHILTSLGFRLTLDQAFLVSPTDSHPPIYISTDSTGWKSMYALFALVISTPASTWKGKARFLAISLPSIFFINLIRIVFTAGFSIRYGFQYFSLLHDFLWSYGLITAIVAVWALWARKLKYNIRETKSVIR